MKRANLIIIILFTSIVCNAQKYYTRSGVTEFKASEKAFEPVEAINNSTTAIFNINKGEVVAQVFIASFEFKNALMQEHFNENYMESTSYPKAVFKGKIDNFSKDKLKTVSEYDLVGTLTVRGKEKKISTKVIVKEVNKKIIVTSNFMVKPEDFNIEIPSIVQEKIAKQIQISIKYELVEKK
jgi:polyisoprenoid-binding protein YceI